VRAPLYGGQGADAPTTREEVGAGDGFARAACDTERKEEVGEELTGGPRLPVTARGRRRGSDCLAELGRPKKENAGGGGEKGRRPAGRRGARPTGRKRGKEEEKKDFAFLFL
jgi:hypothetical protein